MRNLVCFWCWFLLLLLLFISARCMKNDMDTPEWCLDWENQVLADFMNHHSEVHPDWPGDIIKFGKGAANRLRRWLAINFNEKPQLREEVLRDKAYLFVTAEGLVKAIPFDPNPPSMGWLSCFLFFLLFETVLNFAFYLFFPFLDFDWWFASFNPGLVFCFSSFIENCSFFDSWIRICPIWIFVHRCGFNFYQHLFCFLTFFNFQFWCFVRWFPHQTVFGLNRLIFQSFFKTFSRQ